MNAFMIPIILTAAFLLVGCEGNDEPVETPPDTPDPIETPPSDGPLTVSFTEGVLTYSARVMTPTPCHGVSVEESILESDPVQVRINVAFTEPGPDVMCAQVISEETVSGTITLGERPETVTVITPFETHEVHV